MIVFLLGQSSAINSIIYSADVLFKQKIDCFTILEENKRNYFSFCSTSILFFPTIEECIAASNMTIVLDKSSIPSETLSIVQSLSTCQNKSVIHFNLPVKFGENQLEIITNKPCILHIFWGKASQQFEGESLLYYVFLNKNISFKNANKKSYLFLWNAVATSSQEFRMLETTDTKFDVMYVPLSIEKSIMDLRQYCGFFDQVKPDYIIVQTDSSYNDYKELSSAIKYICNCPLNLWIKSRYYSYEPKNMLSYQNKEPIIVSGLDLESPPIRTVISLDMLSKISFPNGIKKYY